MPRPAIEIVALALLALASLAPGQRIAGAAVGGIARAQDAGVARVEIRWERPPEGTLDRGLLGVPSWTVIGVGSVVLAAAALGLVASIRRARGGRR